MASKTAEKPGLSPTFLSRAIEQNADSVLITDAAGHIQYVNAAFEKISGYPKEELYQQTPQILKSGYHSAEFFQKFWVKIQAGEAFRTTFINRRKDGELFYIDQTITPLKNENNEITHFVSICKDITEQKLLEQQREHQLEELGNQKQFLEELLALEQKTSDQLTHHSWSLKSAQEKAQTAHQATEKFARLLTRDLLSPIDNILGFTEMLLKNPNHERRLEMLRQIKIIGRQALDLCQELLEFSSLRSGIAKLNLQSYDFLDTANQSIDNVRSVAARKGIRLTNMVEESYFVKMDRERIATVLHNLLTNAIKFTPRNGHVSLNAIPVRDSLRVEVWDTGPGVPAKYIPHLFSHEDRPHSLGTEGEQGSGWGLPLSQELVQAHGSRIEVKSERGFGSCFSFHLSFK